MTFSAEQFDADRKADQAAYVKACDAEDARWALEDALQRPDESLDEYYERQIALAESEAKRIKAWVKRERARGQA